METEAFFDAIQAGDRTQLEQLLQSEPALLQARDEAGLSPILIAAYHRQTGIAELLASQKVLLDIFEAAVLGRINQIVRILARKPELLNAYSPDGFQPLGLAAFFGHAEVLEFLLRAGADINSLSHNALQVAPVNSAAAGGHVEALRILLDHGADPNSRQAGGFTPLHSAAQNGSLQAVLLLLLNGADLGLKSSEGKTPLDIARESGHPEAVELLRTEITKRFRSQRKIVASQ